MTGDVRMTSTPAPEHWVRLAGEDRDGSIEAFELVSALFQGDPCKAGLVFRLNDGTCDVHPTLAGQGLLAAAVEVAIGGQALKEPER